MILQALYTYAQTMRAYQAEHPEEIDDLGGRIPSPGMEWKSIPYRLVIKEDGTFVDFRKANDEPQEVAKDNARTSGIDAQILWDHLGYVLGIPRTNTGSDIKRAPEQFASFISKIEALPNDIEAFQPVKLFYARKEYEKAMLYRAIIEEIQESNGGRISFELEGAKGALLTSRPEVKAYLNPSTPKNANTPLGSCLVSGKANQPLTITHEKVVVGRDNSPLISIQPSSGFDSYYKEQGLNAPISLEASDAIGTALKHLLQKGKETNYSLAGTTYIFWNSHPDKELLKNYAKATFEGVKSQGVDDDDLSSDEENSSTPKKRKKQQVPIINPNEEVEQVLSSLKATLGTKGANRHSFDSEERFYMLGIMGKTGRHAVKLWIEGSIREIIGNTLQHIEDMNIVKYNGVQDVEYPPLRSLYAFVGQLKPRGKKLDKFSENLIQELVHSIVANRPYPANVQKLCLDRIHHERNINEWKAAILKAYLNRKYRHLKKDIVITMALDKTQTNKAYLAGRLFAVLEKIQSDASSNLNASIRDRYYGAASTKPNSVFGRLFELSQHHLGKLRRRGYGFTLERELETIISALPGETPEFPAYFSPDEQSIFAIGYYHQRTELWAKKENKVSNNED